jgi:cytochrome c oxidase accessory protein FixG
MTVVIDRTRSPSGENGSGPVSAAARVRSKGDAGGGMYQPRKPIYPKLVHGRWRAVKWALMIFTLGVYYITPWLRWTRPGDLPDQAVLIDFTGRRFYIFGLQFWPQEVYFITGLLVIGALALFLTSALFGRLWCGYACPQTVWTDLFIYVERLFEGDRNARMRLDADPWSFNKAWRKIGKHAAWLAVAFSTGGAWIFYFHDAPTVLREFWVGQAPVTAYVSCALLTFTTYALAGTMREQVCTYLCPWPRIQGGMIDNHTLEITYRLDRGEPRAPHKKGASWEGRGDCIDCNQCVVACPMGIDIRDGAQLECINCGLCADACDDIMGKLGRPLGLIAYDTDAAVADRTAGRPAVYKLIRPRTLVYAAALGLVSVVMVWGLFHRALIDVHVLRDRNPVFVRLHDGSIRNGYTLKIANRSFETGVAQIEIDGLPGAHLKTPGAAEAFRVVQATIESNGVRAVRVFVTAPTENLSAPREPITFVVHMPKETVRVPTAFVSDVRSDK